MDTHFRSLQLQRPLNLRAVLRPLRRGSGDPACRIEGNDVAWWATSTPEGAGTVRLEVKQRERLLTTRAWGPGAEWLCEQIPALVGEEDDARGFVPRHGVVANAWRAHRGWRLMRTARPFEACVAAVLEQKVTGHEAWRSWRVILQQFGQPAPGPAATAMRVPPAAREWRQIATWDYRRAGVTPQRIRGLQTVVAAADAIERITALSSVEADQRLRMLPGVGVWTSAEVRQRALGDSDAVSFGDFHVGRDMCWWLTGKRGDDEMMRILLEPYQGHRYRVQRLMEMSGGGLPRRGPRFSPPAHRSW